MFTIDHLGIAVKSLAAAKSIYEKLGLTVSTEEIVPQEKVKLVMVPVGESRLELLEATSDDSTIARFIAKRGEGLHHICLRVPDLAAAQLVLFAYAQRWRIEEFHKTWKSGSCRVEAARLQTVDTFLRWATIMAAVAARIERMKHLSRTSPEQPAIVESDILEPSEAFRGKIDYFSHTRNAPLMLERLASTEPTTLACMHGSAWQ